MKQDDSNAMCQVIQGNAHREAAHQAKKPRKAATSKGL